MTQTTRAHLIVGGFPPGALAGHDMDYARLRLLAKAHEQGLRCTVANDFADVGRWLTGAQLLITYVAGPFPDAAQDAALREWLQAGGRWLALHGTSGGKAVRIDTPQGQRKTMVKGRHHETLGGFFLNHPPVRRFEVRVAGEHPVTRGLPSRFTVADELYLVELLEPAACQVLLTTELAEDPSPPGFGFVYEQDTALQPDGRTRVLGYSRRHGAGEVAYVALGHCHSPASNSQPFVDESVREHGQTPLEFHGAWEDAPFQMLLSNALQWGVGEGTPE